MSNSSLINYTILSPNYSKRTLPISKITIHHAATVGIDSQRLAKLFSSTSRGASCNYAIGVKGDITLVVPEEYCAWTSGTYYEPNHGNDGIAVTFEVANDGGAPDWHVSDAALESVINLCVDICQRNNIPALKFTGNANGNLTMHCYFDATACPGPYLKSKFQYIADEVNKRLGGASYEEREKIDVIYSTYTTKWLDDVVNYNNSWYDGYAGLEGTPFTGIRAKLSKGSIMYRAHTPQHGWLSWITNLEGYGYAGLYGTPIDGIQMKLIDLPGYHVEYRTNILGGSWLDWIRDSGEGDNGYSGIWNKQLDKLQVRIVSDPIYTPKSYKITFNANGGSLKSTDTTITTKYRESCGTFPTPENRIGYKWEGWYTEPQGGKRVQGTDKYTYTDNITLYAQWTPKTYKITYDGNGGLYRELKSWVDDVRGPAIFGKAYTTYSNVNFFVKPGYTFIGWKDQNGTDWTNDIDNPWVWSYDYDVTLYAQWKENTYTVTYDGNGGLRSNGQKTWSNNAIFNKEYYIEPNFFIREGYKFTGWSTYTDKIDTSWQGWDGKKWVWTYTNNVILYAQWEKIPEEQVVEKQPIAVYDLNYPNKTLIVNKEVLRNNEDCVKCIKAIKASNNKFDEEIAKTFFELAPKYGIDPIMAISQSILETGWFKFTGSAVKPSQYNYCGLGVTSNGIEGSVFNNIYEGVTAQLQHLYAYGCKNELNEEIFDPRFKYVTRGIAPYWENLAGRWAVPGYDKNLYATPEDAMNANNTYGQRIKKIFDNIINIEVTVDDLNKYFPELTKPEIETPNPEPTTPEIEVPNPEPIEPEITTPEPIEPNPEDIVQPVKPEEEENFWIRLLKSILEAILKVIKHE